MKSSLRERIRDLDPPATVASGTDTAPPRVGWFVVLVGRIGAWIIYRLIWIFGRTHRWEDVPWLGHAVRRSGR